MSGCDIENLQLSISIWIDKFWDQLRRHRHHGRHRTCKLHPDRIVRLDRAVSINSSTAFAYRFRHVPEALQQFRCTKKADRSTEIRRRALVEKSCRVERQRILVVVLV